METWKKSLLYPKDLHFHVKQNISFCSLCNESRGNNTMRVSTTQEKQGVPSFQPLSRSKGPTFNALPPFTCIYFFDFECSTRDCRTLISGALSYIPSGSIRAVKTLTRDLKPEGSCPCFGQYLSDFISEILQQLLGSENDTEPQSHTY